MSIGATASSDLEMEDYDIINIKDLKFDGNSFNNLTSNTNLGSLLISDGYRSAFIDYYIYNSTGNSRSGTILAIWDLVGGIEFTDTSTTDLNGSTSGFSWDLTNNIFSPAYIDISANILSDSWSGKYTIRLL